MTFAILSARIDRLCKHFVSLENRVKELEGKGKKKAGRPPKKKK